MTEPRYLMWNVCRLVSHLQGEFVHWLVVMSGGRGRGWSTSRKYALKFDEVELVAVMLRLEDEREDGVEYRSIRVGARAVWMKP